MKARIGALPLGLILLLTTLPSVGQTNYGPALYNYEPPSGVAGVTQVYLFGGSFGASQGTSTVTIDGVLAPVNFWSDRIIIVTVPYSAQTGEIVVSTQYGSDSSTNAVNRQYDPYTGTTADMAADFVVLAASSPPLNTHFLQPETTIGCQSVRGTWLLDYGFGTTEAYNLAQSQNADGTWSITGTVMFGPGWYIDPPGPYPVNGSLDQTGTLQLLVPDMGYGRQFKILQPACSHTSMSYYWLPGTGSPSGTPPPSDWLTNYGSYSWNQDIPMVDSIVDCEIPTGETVSWMDYWQPDPILGGDPTIGTWEQDLLPYDTEDRIFDGRIVLEQGPPGTDSCWFLGSQVDWSGQVTGTPWFVNDPQTYGLDFVGFPSGSIQYYRLIGEAGCGVSFTQNMYVTCGSTFQSYATHALSYPVIMGYACSQKDVNKCEPY